MHIEEPTLSDTAQPATSNSSSQTSKNTERPDGNQLVSSKPKARSRPKQSGKSLHIKSKDKSKFRSSVTEVQSGSRSHGTTQEVEKPKPKKKVGGTRQSETTSQPGGDEKMPEGEHNREDWQSPSPSLVVALPSSPLQEEQLPPGNQEGHTSPQQMVMEAEVEGTMEPEEPRSDLGIIIDMTYTTDQPWDSDVDSATSSSSTPDFK